MDSDDLESGKLKPSLYDLDEMSIEAIGEYIISLKAEINRAEKAIKSKQAARTGADAFFKT